MPKGIFHAVVLTDDLDATVRFLTEVAGIGPVSSYEPDPQGLGTVFGWPPHLAATRAALVGEGPGMLEVIAIPEALRATVAPRVALLAVATGDVAGRVDAARAAGFHPRPPTTIPTPGGVDVTVAPVEVGGVGFEFVRFG